MAVTTKWYLNGVSHVANAAVDWDTDTIHVSLHTATYVPDQDAHDFYNDVTNEVSGAGYTAGGQALAGKTRAIDAASNETRLDATDLTWTAVTFTGARYAVIYKKRGGVASADELIGWVDFGADQTVAGVDFTITWAATGVLKITAA